MLRTLFFAGAKKTYRRPALRLYHTASGFAKDLSGFVKSNAPYPAARV